MPDYKKQNPALALLALYFYPSKYLKMEIEHLVACELEFRKIKPENYAQNNYPDENAINDFTKRGHELKSQLKHAMTTSFLWSICTFSVAFLALYVLEKNALLDSIPEIKIAAAMGVVLAVWSGFLQLFDKPESYSRVTLAEKTHKFASMSIFFLLAIATFMSML